MTGCYVDSLYDDDPHPGYDAHDWITVEGVEADHYIDSLLDAADTLRKGEA